MRFVLLLVLSLGLALGLGAASARWALDQTAESGSVTVGSWHADPLTGSVDASPYAKARLAQVGNLTLGIGEGVVFRAETDSAGRRLLRSCRYRLEDEPPVSRIWTLVPYGLDGALLAPREGLPGWLVSDGLMRREDNGFAIEVGPRAAAGNWLATEGEGPFVLVLTLYDTPASSSSGVGDLVLPRITNLGCGNA